MRAQCDSFLDSVIKKLSVHQRAENLCGPTIPKHSMLTFNTALSTESSDRLNSPNAQKTLNWGCHDNVDLSTNRWNKQLSTPFLGRV